MRAVLRAHSPCINQRGERCYNARCCYPVSWRTQVRTRRKIILYLHLLWSPPLPLCPWHQSPRNMQQERIINSRKAHIPGPWPFDRERRGSQGEGLRVCWNNLLSWGKIVPVLMRPPGVIPACIVYHGQEKGKTNFISEFGLT